MSDLTDRLRHMETWDEPLVTAMLDVIDAADDLISSDPDAEAVQETWDDLEDRLARFREVAS